MSWNRKLRQPAVAGSILAADVSTVVLPLGSPASAALSPFSFSKIEGAAGDVAGLTPTVTAFRGLLGEPDNGSNPPAAAGRREINWDGTPDAQSAPNLLPPDFFNTNVPRGAVFVSKNNKFQVSADADNPTNTGVRFSNINGQYDDIFATFSPEKLFTPIAEQLTANEKKIVEELLAVQGKPVDIGGYYQPVDELAFAALRPSKPFNDILAKL